jgi:hypothetical protein
MKDGMSIPQITIPSGALLIDRQIMSPKHFLVGRRSLVASQTATVKSRAITLQIKEANLGLGANLFFLNARMVISKPKTKWKMPVTNISTYVSIYPINNNKNYIRVSTPCADIWHRGTKTVCRAEAWMATNENICIKMRKPRMSGKLSAGCKS